MCMPCLLPLLTSGWKCFDTAFSLWLFLFVCFLRFSCQISSLQLNCSSSLSHAVRCSMSCHVLAQVPPCSVTCPAPWHWKLVGFPDEFILRWSPVTWSAPWHLKLLASELFLGVSGAAGGVLMTYACHVLSCPVTCSAPWYSRLVDLRRSHYDVITLKAVSVHLTLQLKKHWSSVPHSVAFIVL